MKKLLLATSLVAMSSTAIADNTSPLLDTAVTDTLTVTAKFVTPISIGLDTSTIDFGDVWSDSSITAEPVIATVTGEVGETFTYTIGTDGSYVVIAGTDTGSESVAFADSGTTKALNFTIGLDTTNAVTATNVSEIVTFSVIYDAIADTTTDKVS
jgi:hypothetical protein